MWDSKKFRLYFLVNSDNKEVIYNVNKNLYYMNKSETKEVNQ